MVWAGERHPLHQQTNHSQEFSWRIADTNSWPIFSENGDGRRWRLVEWRKWKWVNRHVAGESCPGYGVIIIGPLLTYLCPSTRWAIDQSSPPDPALRHGCNFLPGVPHLPLFRLHVSPPGVSWPSSFPLPLGVPCQGLSCDASCLELYFYQ